MSEPLKLEIRDGIAWITIDRPEVRNALDSRTFTDLTALVRRCGDEPEVRCLVLRGGGERVFVSGADIREFREKLNNPEDAIAYDEQAEELNLAVSTIRKPVIAMLNGHAIGSGCLLAIACDFRIAASHAKFGVPVARIGFSIGPPDLVRLVQLMGIARAKRLLMTGDVITAAEAQEQGLVEQVVDGADLERETAGFAQRLVDAAPLSLAATKEIAANLLAPVPTVRDGAAWYREAYGSRDLQEGLEALVAKRRPNFVGS